MFELPASIVQDHYTGLVKSFFRIFHERETESVGWISIGGTPGISPRGKFRIFVNIKFNKANRVQVTSVTEGGGADSHGGHVQTMKHSFTVLVSTGTSWIELENGQSMDGPLENCCIIKTKNCNRTYAKRFPKFGFVQTVGTSADRYNHFVVTHLQLAGQ